MEPSEVQAALETEGLKQESAPDQPAAIEWADSDLKAIVEAVIYLTDEPLSADQIAIGLKQPAANVGRVLDELVVEYGKSEHGVTVREIAGGYKMYTKPEQHEAVRALVRDLKPPPKPAPPAAEKLALHAYKQT